MADAPASGAGARKGVGVQVPPRARIETRSDQGFTGRGGFSFAACTISMRSVVNAGYRPKRVDVDCAPNLGQD